MPFAEPWTHHRATLSSVGLHYVACGTGPLVVLLHGFPEFWYSWRNQLPALAAAGYRVIAPDLRGYNESDKPRGIRHYRLSLLVNDVAELIEHLGAANAFVDGHDWGGAVAWRLALDRPKRVSRLAILNSPHPSAFQRELKDPLQWLRSWYMFFFQTPWLPEAILRAHHFALLRRGFERQPRRPGAFTADDLQRYCEAYDQPGALTAMIDYYRALLRYPSEHARPIQPLAVPTLLIWGERDPFLSVGMSHHLEPWVHDLRVVRLPEATHWVQHDEPERVSALLAEFGAAHA